jgi:hypothetical protein
MEKCSILHFWLATKLWRLKISHLNKVKYILFLLVIVPLLNFVLYICFEIINIWFYLIHTMTAYIVIINVY